MKEISEDNEVINRTSININEEENTDTTGISSLELEKQLKRLNISLENLEVILLAIILNMNYVKGEKVKLLYIINKTECAKGMVDFSYTPRITNIMYLYSTGVFLDINYSVYKELKSATGKNRNTKAIKKAWKSYLATLLTFIAITISRDNLEP